MTFIQVFFSTTVIMFLAEFADKTSLVAISLASKSKQPMNVFIGSIIGIIFTSVIGIFVALAIGEIIPSIIVILAGLVFIGLGVSNILGKEDGSDDPNSNDLTELKNNEDNTNILIKAVWMVALAEFGDKSQIFLFARTLVDDPLAIFLGAIVGMGIVIGVSIYFGDKLMKKVPTEHVEKVVGIIFIIVGIWLLIEVIF